MANLLYTQPFTGQSITVTHNLDRLNIESRIICSGVTRSDLVDSIEFTSGNERNEFVIKFISSNVGTISLFDNRDFPVNLPSPANYLKLSTLPPASGITDTYMTAFTYDDVNTFTINDNTGSAFTASINVLSATTISGGTLYGDGSNLTLPTQNIVATYFRGVSDDSSTNYNSSTPTAILWDGANIKTAGITHSTGSQPNRVYVDETGIYDLYASAYWTSGGVDRTQLKLTVWVDGIQQTTVGEGQGGYARDQSDALKGMSHISTVLELTGGEYVEIRSEQDGYAGVIGGLVAGQSVFKLIRLDSSYTGVQGPKGDSGTVTNNSGMRSDSFSGLTTTATFHGDGTDLGLQHDRQSVSDTVTSDDYGGWGDIPNLTLDTGDLGTVGDYIISFDCTFENDTKDTENKIRLNVGGDATILTDSVRIQYINDKENKDEYSFSTSAFGENISAGTTIKAQFDNSGGMVEIWGATLTIDGIRTTNNIS